ncbi:MAG: response regulator [Methanobacteriota archaeon]|nr:MAG: response regulator [Euryarchaeota archaeon]
MSGSRRNRKKLIMVVDDEPEILFIVKSVLSKHGYTVVESRSGEECLKELEHLLPDMILLDIAMPGIDGWEVCRKIKEKERTKKIPVSMLSIFSDKTHIERSLHYAGADHHMKKPIEFSELLHTVDSMLSN